MRRITTLSFAVVLVVSVVTPILSQSQPAVVDSSHSGDTMASVDTATTTTAPTPVVVDTVVLIPKLDFANIRLFDALIALARAYNLSLYIDSSVTGNISMRLENVLLNDALLFIMREHRLTWERTGNIIKIFRPVPPTPKPIPLNIQYSGGLLTADLKDADLKRLVDTLITMSGRNIIIEDQLQGRVTGKINQMALSKALQVLLPANGFTVREIDNVTYVGRQAGESGERAQSRNLRVTCDSGLVTLEAANVPLSDVITMLSSECGVSILMQSKIDGTASAQISQKSVEETLTYLLMSSLYTFKETGGVFLIGNRDSQDLFVSRLLSMDNLVASTVEPLIPVALSQQLTVKVVKEQNGLLVTGPRTSIVRLEDFVREIDIPSAQVLFEVLVVDYLTSEQATFKLTANNFGGDSTMPGRTYYPGWDYSVNGEEANEGLRSLERRLDLPNLGVLDDDFFLRLQVLVSEGKANIQSRPQIATLNGHTASISIGTTQYYLLKSETVYPSSQSNLSTQTTQRFETIKANMSLEVTPYVSRNRDVIVDVAPEFSTPSGKLNPDVPPTINSRVLKSTVRLKDGETIVLGGLVQDTKSATIDKVPILGSIPILGRLFQNRSSEDSRSELMIYITPHVYFGSEGALNRDSLIIKR
jgi:type IV pilus assembly protein PilQ